MLMVRRRAPWNRLSMAQPGLHNQPDGCPSRLAVRRGVPSEATCRAVEEACTGSPREAVRGMRRPGSTRKRDRPTGEHQGMRCRCHRGAELRCCRHRKVGGTRTSKDGGAMKCPLCDRPTNPPRYDGGTWNHGDEPWGEGCPAILKIEDGKVVLVARIVRIRLGGGRPRWYA